MSRDVELHGTVIPRGSKLALLNGSGDRDERHFEDPDRFDVRRVIDRHLAFGYGTHFCIGAALARLEGRVGLAETLRRFPTWDDRRAPARLGAHQHGARVHLGADASELRLGRPVQTASVACSLVARAHW